MKYKESSLLYLPRIQKFLRAFTVPYNARIVIIDILVKEKKTSAVRKMGAYVAWHKSTTRPPLPDEINEKKRQRLLHPALSQQPSYSAIVLPSINKDITGANLRHSIDTDTSDTPLRASTDFRQASLSTILEEIYSSFRQPRSY